MADYFARVVFAGTSTPQSLNVQASSAAEARKVIDSMYGQVKRYASNPTRMLNRLPGRSGDLSLNFP